MRVIAEFVDARNGKRYLPGQGNAIDPALTEEQVARLKIAKCLADGEEIVAGKIEAGAITAGSIDASKIVASLPSDKELRKMSATQLAELAKVRGVDIGSTTKASDIIKLLQAADAAKPEQLPTLDVLQGMTLEQLDEIGAKRGVDLSACETVEEAVAVLTAPAA